MRCAARGAAGADLLCKVQLPFQILLASAQQAVMYMHPLGIVPLDKVSICMVLGEAPVS